MEDDIMPDRIYETVKVWWAEKDSATMLTLHDTTVSQAIEDAIFFGYVKPVWYKPWTYITNQLTIKTY